MSFGYVYIEELFYTAIKAAIKIRIMAVKFFKSLIKMHWFWINAYSFLNFAFIFPGRFIIRVMLTFVQKIIFCNVHIPYDHTEIYIYPVIKLL